jgi:hypothetical protein
VSSDVEDENGGRTRPENLAGLLNGNTLKVYWFMLRSNKPYSAREIQRRTGISSSSLALHHLNKLTDLGLVGTDGEGRYLVLQKIRPGLLSLFVGSGRLFIPRFVFYSVFTTILLTSSLFLFLGHLDTASILLILSLLVTSAMLWFETMRLWKAQPV